MHSMVKSHLARESLALITGLALLLSLLGISAAQARPVLDWLELGEEISRDYVVERFPDDTARLVVRPSWTAAAPDKHLLLLLPKKSVAAYSTSVATILRVFREQKAIARFDLWFYDSDPEIAAEAVAWAEAESVDLMMTVGSDATSWVHDNYRGQGLLPVVTSASKDPVFMGQMPDYQSGSGTNIAYTSINVPIDVQLAYYNQLIPGLKNIGVIYAENNSSAIQTQLVPLQDIGPDHGINVIDVSVRNEAWASEDLAENVPAAVEAMRENDPELGRSVFLITGSTAVYERVDQINQFADRVPVLATLPDVVSGRDGAVVSIGINQSSAVHLATFYALDILEGRAAAAELPVGVVNPPDIAISFQKAREIGLEIPFSFFESATFVYDYEGKLVREEGQRVVLSN